MVTKQRSNHYKRMCCVHCLLLYTFSGNPDLCVLLYRLRFGISFSYILIKYVNIQLYGNKWQICPHGDYTFLVCGFLFLCKIVKRCISLLQIIQNSKLHPLSRSVHSNTNLTSLESIQPCYNYYSHSPLLKTERNSPSFKKATRVLIPNYTRLKDLTF